MTEDADYEDYRNTLAEIVDGGGCVETMTAAADLRGERGGDGDEDDGAPSRRDLLGSDALATGVAESVDDVVREVDAETARESLRAGYDDLDDVRAAFRRAVDPALFDALGEAGVDLALADLALDPAVCLKTFVEADLETAMTLVPEVRDGTVRDRVVAREATGEVVVTVHALPDEGRSYAVVGSEGGRTLVLPDGRTVDCAGADDEQTGLDCDPDRAARTEYRQTVVAVDGTDYVIETVCTTV